VTSGTSASKMTTQLKPWTGSKVNRSYTAGTLPHATCLAPAVPDKVCATRPAHPTPLRSQLYVASAALSEPGSPAVIPGAAASVSTGDDGQQLRAGGAAYPARTLGPCSMFSYALSGAEALSSVSSTSAAPAAEEQQPNNSSLASTGWLVWWAVQMRQPFRLCVASHSRPPQCSRL